MHPDTIHRGRLLYVAARLPGLEEAWTLSEAALDAADAS
jgi:hypothetical protein